MSYGAYHRLTGESGPKGSVGYSYDLDGQRTGMSIDGETAAGYAYNEDGQLTGIETPTGTSPSPTTPMAAPQRPRSPTATPKTIPTTPTPS